MSKCYYCNNCKSGCPECKKPSVRATKEIPLIPLSEEDLLGIPSPNGKNPCAEVKVSTVLGRSTEEVYQELKKQLLSKTPPKDVKHYGWVSKQHSRHGRTVVYRHIDGSEVEISFVTLSPIHHGTGWTDCKCIGEVTDFIRPG